MTTGPARAEPSGASLIARAASPITSEDIVVGIDGTDDGRAAVAWAVEEARLTRKRVVLVHVAEPDQYSTWFPSGVLREVLLDLGETVVRHAVDEAHSYAGNVPVRGVVRIGRAEQVLEQAAASSYEIVVGLRGRSLASRLLLGSIGHHLLRTAARPVVLVPRLPVPVDLAVSGTERVVVAIGGSTGAGAVDYGFAQAVRRHRPLVLLHADAHPSGHVSDLAVENNRRLVDLITSRRAENPLVTATIVTVDSPLDVALAHHTEATDLLVLGHRPPAGAEHRPVLDRPMLPVLRHPPTTVVVVPDRVPAATREPALSK